MNPDIHPFKWAFVGIPTDPDENTRVCWGRAGSVEDAKLCAEVILEAMPLEEVKRAKVMIWRDGVAVLTGDLRRVE